VNNAQCGLPNEGADIFANVGTAFKSLLVIVGREALRRKNSPEVTDALSGERPLGQSSSVMGDTDEGIALEARLGEGGVITVPKMYPTVGTGAFLGLVVSIRINNLRLINTHE